MDLGYQLSSYQVLLTVIIGLILTEYSFQQSVSTCTWPAVFEHSTWYGSAHGDLVFKGTSLTGLPVSILSYNINSWHCHQSGSFSNDSKILIRSDSIDLLSSQWIVYVCLHFTKITNNSYRYYRWNKQETGAGQHRVLVTRNATSSICDEVEGAVGSEFVTIIRKGLETEAYVACPTILQGSYDVTMVDGVGSKICAGQSLEQSLTMCGNQTKVMLKHLCESSSTAFTVELLHCVGNITSGGHTYVQFFNPEDTVDNESTFRFSCMSISSQGSQATMVYKNCTSQQTPTLLPVSHNGSVIGSSYTIKTGNGDC